MKRATARSPHALPRVAAVGLLAVAIVLARPLAAPGAALLAQAPPEATEVAPAAPLTASELGPIFAAAPSSGLQVIGVVHVGQLLSPATLDWLVGGIRTAVPGVSLGGLEELYQESVRPVAEAVASCVVWLADEPGAVCAGDFGPSGFDVAGVAFGDCLEQSATCGTSETLFPGHRLRWSAEGQAATLVDDRWLVLEADLERARQRAASLISALDAGSAVPPPSLAGVQLDVGPTLSFLGVVPEDVQTDISSALSRPLALGAVRLQLDVSRAPEALLELRAMVAGPQAAGELRQAIAALALVSLAADPASSRLLGDDPVAALDEMIQAQGDEVILRFEGSTLTGVLAAVAVPAFVRYVRRAETEEARTNVDSLYLGAVAYFHTEHVDPQGHTVVFRLPDSAPRTPPEVPCAQAVAPQPETWAHPTWEALNFAIRDPHRYSYQFDASPEGAAGRFSVTAFGDLDCDGRLSTFQRLGTVEPLGTGFTIRAVGDLVIVDEEE